MASFPSEGISAQRVPDDISRVQQDGDFRRKKRDSTRSVFRPVTVPWENFLSTSESVYRQSIRSFCYRIGQRAESTVYLAPASLKCLRTGLRGIHDLINKIFAFSKGNEMSRSHSFRSYSDARLNFTKPSSR